MKSFYFKFFSILAILCLGFLVYSNTFFSSFHFDDEAYIVNNYAIRNLQNLFDIWNVCPCRVITFLSIALNYHFSHLNVFAYHVFNLIIHLVSACLVWWLIFLTFSTPLLKNDLINSKRLGNLPAIVALLAALIFVSHPIQTEAVTYIWQRAASMVAFFYLASLCFYIKARLLDFTEIKKEDSDPSQEFELSIGKGFPYYIFSLITAVAAMFTKENAITLPLMILLYEFCFLRSRDNQKWVQLFPLMIIMFIIPRTMMLTMSARFQELKSIVEGPGGISPWDYLLTQLRVMMTYLRLMILPINLNLDYDYPVFRNFFDFPVMAGFISLSAILIFAKRMFTKYRLISFSIFWFFLTLLPESSILPQADVIFEHRLYLPIVGYCLLLASFVYYFPKRFKIIMLLLLVVILFNSFLTYQRNKTWANEIILWNDVVSKSPHKARGYINRGWAYYNQGNFNQALSDDDKAILINPKLLYPYDDRGLIYAKEGRFDDAILEYTKAIDLNPYFAEVYYNRGNSYYQLDNYQQALNDFNEAIIVNPEYVDAYNKRGNLFLKRGKTFQALSDYKKSIKIDPDQAEIKAKLSELNESLVQK